MKVSTKGRYALRIMLDLAMHDTGESVRVKEIAQRQNISDKYLEQIISVLNRAGYVKSTRGPQGGYRLAKKPGEYTVGMILRLTEGSLSPVACLDENESNCERQTECITYTLWKKIDDAVSGVVDRYTLEDLLEWQRDKANNYII